MQAYIDAHLRPFAPEPAEMVTTLKAAVTGFNPAVLFPDTPQEASVLDDFYYPHK